MAEFTLANNPFWVLGVSVRNTPEEIADAYEDAMLDGRHDEHALLQSQQQLAGPRTRLEAELQWLPELTPSSARELLAVLKGEVSSWPSVDAALKLPGLSAANLLAELVSRSPGSKEYILGLAKAHNQVVAQSALRAINENRQIAGISEAPSDLVSELLPKLVETHARVASHSISTAPQEDQGPQASHGHRYAWPAARPAKRHIH